MPKNHKHGFVGADPCIRPESEIKFVIIAPYWHKPFHDNRYRTARFIRWLREAGADVVLICAGSENRVVETEWGVELIVKDKRYRLRASSWAKRVVKTPVLQKYAKGAGFVLSPSSLKPLYLASLLAKRLNSKLIIDIENDGIVKSFHRKKTLYQANKIFVASEVWRNLLIKRFPLLDNKTIVLTNGYSLSWNNRVKKRVKQSGEEIVLLYAGNFRNARVIQTIDFLLVPLFDVLIKLSSPVRIILEGQFTGKDLKEIKYWENRFQKTNIILEVVDIASRKELLGGSYKMDGLLLLSMSRGEIPNNFFKYLPTGRPIFAVTSKNSVVSSLAKEIPQMCVVEGKNSHNSGEVVKKFIDMCMGHGYQVKIPGQYRNKCLSKIFLDNLL